MKNKILDYLGAVALIAGGILVFAGVAASLAIGKPGVDDAAVLEGSGMLIVSGFLLPTVVIWLLDKLRDDPFKKKE